VEAHVEAVRWKHFSGFLRSNPPCSGVLYLLCMSQYEARRGDANGPGAQCQLIGTMPVTLLGWPWMLRCARLSMPLCSRPGVPVRLGAQGDVWRIRGLGARVSAEFADVCVDVVGGPSAREGLPGLAGSSLLDRGCRVVRA
jgi:hypothetical protein